MKLLQKMLIIKWHYLEHELLEFKGINFLTGKNGAGKSTIIDALQLVMLGETAGYFFNKAANDRSTRSLKGYLRGEVSEDEDRKTVYLRENDFTSYIVLEFTDTVERKNFCLGAVFDSYRDGDHKHQFFYLKDDLPPDHFYLEGRPMNIKALKAWLLNHYPKRFQVFESNKDYREVMSGVLGHLNERFFRLFRKAVPFSPIIDIKGFITEFVCDAENEVDITHMQENIRQYKQLEEELALVEKKVVSLSAIAGRYVAFHEERERLLVQQYLLDRADVERRDRELQALQGEMERLAAQMSLLEQGLAADEKRYEHLDEQRSALREERAVSDIYQKQQTLLHNKGRLASELEEINNAANNLQSMLTRHLVCWREVVAWSAENVADPIKQSTVTAHEALGGLEAARRRPATMEHDLLMAAKTALDELADKLRQTRYEKQQESRQCEKQRDVLQEELVGLRQGIKPYPEKLLALRRAIAAELGEKAKPQIFADLLEIRNPKWQNAVEAYLHTQKFYLLVEPASFLEALQVYDHLKFARGFFDLGLVDAEKVLAQSPHAMPGSLAEEVETSDPLARAYADYLLGRVMKCEKLEELRRHRTAITPDGMLYHNFVARQLDPARYAAPYIGRQAISRQITQKEANLREQERCLAALAPVLSELEKVVRTPQLTENDIHQLLNLKVKAGRLTETQEKFRSVTAELGALDLSYLVRLESRLKECEAELEKTRRTIDKNKEELLRGDMQKEALQKQRPVLSKEKQEKNAELAQNYGEVWRAETGEPRFRQEMKSRKTPERILADFERVVKATETKKNDRWHELVALRVDYNRDFKGSFSWNSEDNRAYDSELTRLQETAMLEYRQKIQEAKERAQVQFKEDFISKLRANIDRVTEQIADLNRSIRDNFFGRDRYRLTVTPQPQYRRFYDIITDELLVEGHDLFSAAFQEKHGDAIEDLFRQIVDVGDGLLTADRRQQLAENLHKFTDYRTYLEFDMLNIDDEGRESRLSRVITKKSGGETQTPFYLAVLASFLQVYRVKQNESNTLRLIIFDEAYSKMDHQRIQESIRMIRDMGLQVILSAPTEKIGDIAPLVDRNLCVTRIRRRTLVRAFDHGSEQQEMGA